MTALALGVGAEAASAACQGGDAVPVAGEEARTAAAVVCVVNEERAARGLSPLQAHDRLADAASRHARDMVRKRYFSHTAPDGSTVGDRLRRGYIRPRDRWRVGEALAWGTDSKAAPAAIVRAWLASPPHRRLLLSRKFRDIGIGVELGVPVRREAGATYAAELGARR